MIQKRALKAKRNNQQQLYISKKNGVIHLINYGKTYAGFLMTAVF